MGVYISPKQAAAVLGVHPQWVRRMMQRGEVDLGVCTSSKKGVHTYRIYRSKLEKLIGRELTEEELAI